MSAFVNRLLIVTVQAAAIYRAVTMTASRPRRSATLLLVQLIFSGREIPLINYSNLCLLKQFSHWCLGPVNSSIDGWLRTKGRNKNNAPLFPGGRQAVSHCSTGSSGKCFQSVWWDKQRLWAYIDKWPISDQFLCLISGYLDRGCVCKI
jgi:hypothetical protein